MVTLITVPKHNALFKNYGSEPTVTKWLKSDGQRVDADEPVAVVESTKATIDVEAPVAGLVFILKQEQEPVKIGDALGVIAANAEEFAAFKNSQPR
jgi:pyruvate/2-oxoglutarate dehydrogenase complex dihydrolipoamide acyltransferase (E2) component